MTIDDRFHEFHEAHPEVYDEIVSLCRQWRARGRERWSIDGVYHVIRWQRRIAGLPAEGEQFKLNDHFTACYARLVMEQEPDLAGMFEVRYRPSAGGRLVA